MNHFIQLTVIAIYHGRKNHDPRNDWSNNEKKKATSASETFFFKFLVAVLRRCSLFFFFFFLSPRITRPRFAIRFTSMAWIEPRARRKQEILREVKPSRNVGNAQSRHCLGFVVVRQDWGGLLVSLGNLVPPLWQWEMQICEATVNTWRIIRAYSEMENFFLFFFFTRG